MSNTETTESTESPSNALDEAKRNELVNFVANNILNSITLNQTITVIQQVALRDATKIVAEADAEKLAQIEQAFEAATTPPAEQEQQVDEKPAAKKTKKKTTRARRSWTYVSLPSDLWRHADFFLFMHV